MKISTPLGRCVRLLHWTLLSMGLGTAWAGAPVTAEAHPADARPQMAPTTDGAAIRLRGGRLYLSEAGGEFREISLGDTAEARLLTQILERAGAGNAARVPVAPALLAGAGGCGFHWTPADDADAPPPSGASSEHKG